MMPSFAGVIVAVAGMILLFASYRNRNAGSSVLDLSRCLFAAKGLAEDLVSYVKLLERSGSKNTARGTLQWMHSG